MTETETIELIHDRVLILLSVGMGISDRDKINDNNNIEGRREMQV